MPVAELDLRRLARIAGAPRARLVAALPYLGLDIESLDARTVRVEYSPNRPDYATDFGIAHALRGLLGAEEGMAQTAPARSRRYAVRAERAPRARPYVMGVAATGRRLDRSDIAQLIALQEDLHAGLCRGRRVAAIGMHDLSKTAFPLLYRPAALSEEFVPLGWTRKRAPDLGAVLRETEAGKRYAGLLRGAARVPLLVDAEGRAVSFPPIINSERTALRAGARGVLVEVTGADRRVMADVLAVAAATLRFAGFETEAVRSTGAGNSAPRLQPRRMSVRSVLASESLGVSMPPAELAAALRRSRLDAAPSRAGVRCTIPPHRFDILGEMDLVEEAALGYGIANIEPELQAQASAGERLPGSAALDRISACMIGLGYTEALCPVLVGPRVLGALPRSPRGPAAAGAKSEEHSVLRGSLLPGLLDALSRNVHAAYPQRMFETGAVFARGAAESVHLAAVTAHSGAGYTEAKSALGALARLAGATLRTRAADHAAFEPGHSADIVISGRRAGHIGDLSRAVLDRLRVRERAAAFELDVSQITGGAARPSFK